MKTSTIIRVIDTGLLIIGVVFGITFLVSGNPTAGGFLIFFSANIVFNMTQKKVVRKREQMWQEFLEKTNISHMWEQYKKKL